MAVACALRTISIVTKPASCAERTLRRFDVNAYHLKSLLAQENEDGD
jgi:hypothetical protein